MNKGKKKGFTLVEILIDFVIIAAVATAVVSAFSGAFKAISSAKARIAAVALANERMEIIRNMPYNDVGTDTGTYPPGIIPAEENVVRKNITFTVYTDIRYKDDPFDGTTETDPPDLEPYDYKKVEIVVRKRGEIVELAKLTTNIAGSVAETDSGTGVLYFCAIDSKNYGVPGATVTIENDTLDPPLFLTYTTEEDGCVMIPMLPPDRHNNYHVEVTKPEYSSDQTYPRTSQNPNQTQPDIDIYEQQVNRLTLAIDETSTMLIRMLDESGNPLPDLEINLEGTKETQFNPETYKYSENHLSDENGEIALQDMEWDDYKISMVTSGHYISSTVPLRPIGLEPNTDLSVSVYVTTSATSPRISTFDPQTAVSGDQLYLYVAGENFDNSPVVKIISETGEEIVGTSIVVEGGSEIRADFNLIGAATGEWDIMVENQNGESVVQRDLLNIISGT